MSTPVVKNLPGKLNVSGLIHMALDDLISVERSKRYHVDMGQWHNPNGHCSVCFAGAVMARTMECDPTKAFEPMDFSYKVECQLNFLDAIRNGNIRGAWDDLFYSYRLGYTTRKYPLAFEEIDVPPYYNDPRLFKIRLRNLAKKFEAVGY